MGDMCPKCGARKKAMTMSGKNKGKRLGPCKPCKRVLQRAYYLKNRDKKIQQSKDYQKRTNYASEKSEEARRRRSIKRKTRYHFPITDQKCSCGKPAAEHHHTTDPIEFDKFIYACKTCHTDIHIELNKEEEN